MTTASIVQALQAELAERGALLEGHFRLSSGRHSDRFVQKFRLLEEPRLVALAAEALRADMASYKPTAVVSAAVGGIVLGYELARQYGCKAIFAEKEAGKPVFRRGFSLTPDDRVIVVEDVVTTGGSVKEVLELVGATGAHILGIGVIVQRAQVDFGYPTVALLDMPITSYDETECPFCSAGLPITDPGSRRLSAGANVEKGIS